MPTLSVFAGPNGSGKSTFVARYSFEGKENLLDPDAVAKRINPSDPSAAAIEAAREVIVREREYLKRGRSFAIETTLSGNIALATMKLAKQTGFSVRLVYICLDNPGLNAQRVGERVSRGGHNVPGAAAIRIADEAIGYDNTDDAPRKVFEARQGAVTWRSSNLPAWARPSLD